MMHFFITLGLLLLFLVDSYAQSHFASSIKASKAIQAQYSIQTDYARFTRRSPLKKGAVIGAFIGAAAGAVVGYTSYSETCIIQTGACVDRGPIYSAAYSAAVGAALGVGAGLTIGIASRIAEGGNGLRQERYLDQDLHFTSTTFPESFEPESMGIGIGFKM